MNRDQLCVNAIRALAMDACEAAGSGHPGTAMALASLGWVLFTRIRRHDPGDPSWRGRDRFVLSCGHASLLQYALLYLTGYDYTLEDFARYRQWKSRTPGHPELDLESGIEATTGPLGQGVANAVGLALARDHFSARFDRPGSDLFDYRVFCICSDGDLMEGISHEAASLAGHLQLDRLVLIYDDNHVSIEGPTEITFGDDTEVRFASYGWTTHHIADPDDLGEIERTLAEACHGTGPQFVRIRTHIAHPSPHMTDDPEAHGAPLGAKEVRATKEVMGWPLEPPFAVPPEAREYGKSLVRRWKDDRLRWCDRLADYRQRHVDEGRDLERLWLGRLPCSWSDDLPRFLGKPIATREASGEVMRALFDRVPELVGGSADLAPSTLTWIQGFGAFGSAGGAVPRQIHFGVREHAMAAICNGLALEGLRPFCATFLIFSDYMRPAQRLAALMSQRVIYVLSHDSVGLGGDGPTHQPVEQLAALRAIPNMTVLRPADANETRVCWEMALERDGPVCLALSRQKLPILEADVERARRGAYILKEAAGSPQVILIATGAEVHVALEARELLVQDGLPTRVVSMPSWEVFGEQEPAYREEVLPAAVTVRIAIEAASPMGWDRYVGQLGAVVGMTSFGASAPGDQVLAHFGFSAGNIAAIARQTARRQASAAAPETIP